MIGNDIRFKLPIGQGFCATWIVNMALVPFNICIDHMAHDWRHLLKAYDMINYSMVLDGHDTCDMET